MKSVLVIDTPTTCTDCPCYDYIHGVCANTHKDCELRKQAKPSWCPLRPLPNRKEDLHYPCNEYLQAINEGWNACIDVITGETE